MKLFSSSSSSDSFLNSVPLQFHILKLFSCLSLLRPASNPYIAVLSCSHPKYSSRIGSNLIQLPKIYHYWPGNLFWIEMGLYQFVSSSISWWRDNFILITPNCLFQVWIIQILQDLATQMYSPTCPLSFHLDLF